MGRTWIDNAVIDAGLSAQALALYVNIKRRMCGIADADRNKYLVERDGQVCFSLQGVSVQSLLKASGLSKNTFARFSQELVDAGFLMVDVGCLDGMKRKTNVYYIPVSMDEFRGQEMEEETVKAQTGGVIRTERENPLKQPTVKGFPKSTRRKSTAEARKELEAPAEHQDIRQMIAKKRGYGSHSEMVAKKEEEAQKRAIQRVQNSVNSNPKRVSSLVSEHSHDRALTFAQQQEKMGAKITYESDGSFSGIGIKL